MVYITGDCHGDFYRFRHPAFAKESKGMTKNDIMIICGDFGGIWNGGDAEDQILNRLAQLPFTIVFCDGNHENFDRLYSNEFPVIDFHGGKAHEIRKGIYHLMRGYIFEFDGKNFWVMGGASSHDIDDGILNPKDFPDTETFIYTVRLWRKYGRIFRIKHISWWEQELPSKEEMEFGLQTLKEYDNTVDFIITHCAPQSICSFMGFSQPDSLTNYLESVAREVTFGKWYFGHYHTTQSIFGKFVCLYDTIERIV